jgi:hypothetical protein
MREWLGVDHSSRNMRGRRVGVERVADANERVQRHVLIRSCVDGTICRRIAADRREDFYSSNGFVTPPFTDALRR